MPTSLPPLDRLPLQWQSFHTQADINVAQVYVRVHADVDLQPYWDAGWRLTGDIYGPQCRRSHTLPARYTFEDQGPGSSFLAQAILPDPCFWSDQVPSLYQATWQLSPPQETTIQQQALLGLRSLAIKNRQLILNTEAWEFRAASIRKLNNWSVEQYHEHSLVMILEQPDSSLLKEASELGTWVAAVLSGDEDAICEQLVQMAAWPAVCMAIIRSPIETPERLRQVAPNLILGQWLQDPGDLPSTHWSQLLFCEANTPETFSAYTEGCSLPLIAVRSGNDMSSAADVSEAFQLFKSSFDQDQLPAGYAII